MNSRPARTYKTMIIGIAIFSVIATIVIVVGWFYILNLSNEANRLRSEEFNSLNEAEKLSDLAYKYKKVLPKESLILETIPTTKDVSTFVADFENLAKKSNLVITTSIIGDSKTKSQQKGNDFTQTIKKQEYFQLPIKYEIIGKYGDVTKFITELSNLRRLSSIDDVSVTADYSDKVNLEKVRSIFTVYIYGKQ